MTLGAAGLDPDRRPSFILFDEQAPTGSNPTGGEGVAGRLTGAQAGLEEGGKRRGGARRVEGGSRRVLGWPGTSSRWCSCRGGTPVMLR